MSGEMNDSEPNLLEPAATAEEQNHETSIRPRDFSDYIGQKQVVDELKLYIEAARRRGDALDHCLFSGPSGLGKTTLSHIVALQMGAQFHTISAPAIDKKGDLAAILSNLAEGDVLFIDEIHRLPRVIEEVLYGAMEDFKLDIIIGQGPAARVLKLDLPKFTLIGATTRAGLLTTPLRSRFGIPFYLDFYNPQDLQTILTRSARILGIAMEAHGALEIAKRSRGTPRIANRLLRRVRDYAQVLGDGKIMNLITKTVAEKALARLDIDSSGLDTMDRKILLMIAEKFEGGPVGIDTLAAAISEERDTIEDVYEPFLLKEGFINRTPRGRMVTNKTIEFLKIRLD